MPASSSHQLTQSIQDVLFHRLYTMYMHMQDFLLTEKSRQVKRLMQQFLQVTLVISLLHFMLRIWDFLLISLYVLLMRIRCYTISLQRVSMTETEISFLQHHHLWIFLSQATLKDLSIEQQATVLRGTASLWLHLKKQVSMRLLLI